ncbi:GHMP kinase [Allosaccharopolyspora coralli]|uniref:GHMP kinase n=1 Tax=Allosaccharopolyspora coralli TaxID=2665642 RepID=A0A5Q3Q8I5_9PSEU|nr:GHMP kinase [Allosaccharopolyspora coralli]QGK70120.1 GHMP kinase [Allosaccharopolyspora coralli]
MLRGFGHAPCHFGELIQGVFRSDGGAVCRALVTLPMTEHGTSAHFTRIPDSGLGDIAVVNADRAKARRAAEITARRCAQLAGVRGSGGRLVLDSDVPVGIGMGSSTSDVLATIRAVASAFDVRLPPETTVSLAVEAETACDPLMLDERPVLFGPRNGRALEVLGPNLPPMVVLGCTTGNAAAVDTVSLPDVPVAAVEDYERLRTDVRRAVATGDVGLLGKACTHSARLNQSLLPKKEFEALEDIARRCGAAGVQVAHSGNVAGILLDARSPDLARCLEWGTTLLAQYDMTATVVFRAGGNPQSGTCVASNSARAVRREGVGAGVRPHR